MGWLSRRKRRHDYEQEFLDEVFVHWDGLYRFALRLTGSEAEAEDLVQEALAKAFKAFERLREGTNHRAWIYTIVRNCFLSRVRKAGREAPLDEPGLLADPHQRPIELALVRQGGALRHGFEDQVLAALEALPEAQRSAVVLCDIEGLTYDEIAQVLACPVGTVRSRIHHARRRLRSTLAGYAASRGYEDAEQAG